jgi:hypothetical protein
VTRGLALNRLGDRAALTAAADVALVRAAKAETVEGVFQICVPVTDSLNKNLGLYVFTIAPASGLEGRAPMTELGTEGVAGKCGSRYEVEGVKFDCRPVTLPTGDAPARVEARALFTALQTKLQTLAAGEVSPELHKLRNIAAHLMFGSDVSVRDWQDPLNLEVDQTAHGWLQELRNQKRLTECEVPLALIFWSIRGIEFVDMWAVRRRISIARHTHRPFSWLIAPRRTVEAEARLRQFQDQLEALRAAHPSPQTLSATSCFRYLPSAGLLPVVVATGDRRGNRLAFNPQTFFAGIVTRDPVFVEGARLEPLLRSSLEYPACDLSDPSMLWLYAARENSQAIAAGTGVPSAYLAFATGHLPFYGLARFDVSQWDYSNFSAFDEGVFA